MVGPSTTPADSVHIPCRGEPASAAQIAAAGRQFPDVGPHGPKPPSSTHVDDRRGRPTRRRGEPWLATAPDQHPADDGSRHVSAMPKRRKRRVRGELFIPQVERTAGYDHASALSAFAAMVARCSSSRRCPTGKGRPRSSTGTTAPAGTTCLMKPSIEFKAILAGRVARQRKRRHESRAPGSPHSHAMGSVTTRPGQDGLELQSSPRHASRECPDGIFTRLWRRRDLACRQAVGQWLEGALMAQRWRKRRLARVGLVGVCLLRQCRVRPMRSMGRGLSPAV